ncbi:ribosomal 50S subunit-recycling heat shock protein [Bacilli bacterium PM5-3]|nr:ribosomal 50S subunit-recycling heat shock protein [Bacilli bacterium PM5-3]MDH6603317.1 ribosomal 50S subunit-recycling heat shock protein [Bacilli bacterium PM5-9]
MRIDKFLQVSRIIKRRSVAKEIVEKKRVLLNNKVAKPSSSVNVDDILSIQFGDTTLELKVLLVSDKVKKDQANEMYEIIKREDN